MFVRVVIEPKTSDDNDSNLREVNPPFYCKLDIAGGTSCCKKIHSTVCYTSRMDGCDGPMTNMTNAPVIP
jgi:hypothetical protein